MSSQNYSQLFFGCLFVVDIQSTLLLRRLVALVCRRVGHLWIRREQIAVVAFGRIGRNRRAQCSANLRH